MIAKKNRYNIGRIQTHMYTYKKDPLKLYQSEKNMEVKK